MIYVTESDDEYRQADEKPAPLNRQPVLIRRLSPGSNTGVAEVPLLQFGMMGFSHEERHQIEGIVELLPQTSAIWQAGRFENADAWLLGGQKTRALPGVTESGCQNLRILAGLPSEKAITLNSDDINRPLAFSLPMHNADMEPGLTFESASPQGIYNVLQQFEKFLWGLRSQIVLGKQLIERESELKQTIYHVLHNRKLIAVLDFTNWKIGMLPNTNPQLFEDAFWEKRPAQAHDIPGNFSITDVAQLRWIYAQHSARTVLPARYQEEVIYFRRAPQVEVSWLRDSHLLLLHELTKQPATFDTLIKRTGLPYEQMTRDLASLYFAASLTTTRSKAAQVDLDKALHSPQKTPSGVNNSLNIFNSSSQNDGNAQDASQATVSAQLR